MARISVRDFLKLRASFLSYPNSTPILIQPSKPSPFCSFSRSHFTSAKTRPLYKQTLDFLDSCQSLTHLFQIQAHLITSGLLQHPSFSGRLLELCSHICELDYTVLIFRCIKFPTTFCVNTVIKAYASSSVPQKAVIFYLEMLKDGFFPNSFSFPPLLSACSKIVCLNLGQQYHGQAVKNGVDNVLPVQNSLVHLYYCCGLMYAAWRVFVKMSVRDMVSWNTVLNGLCKAGESGFAHELFDRMPKRNVVTWNIMITCYLELGDPGNGLKMFREMVKVGLQGNDTTMVNVLTACGRSVKLKEGKSVHGSLIRNFGNSSLFIDTSSIDMYSRCRRVDLAQLIFDRMSEKNLVSWNAMILGHCLHGNPKDGLNLYAEMTGRKSTCEDCEINFGENMKPAVPDEITFIGVLCACAREGRLREGRNYFSEMVDVFGVKPNFAHYWCMANIFAKVGLREEAIDLLRNIPLDNDTSPETSMWAAGLFSSCRFKGDITLAEQQAKQLVEQDPQNFSYYSLLVNVYAVAGRWDDVARTKAMMKKNGIRRIPGCGLEDLKEIVHSLKVGNNAKNWVDSWQITTEGVNS